MTYKSILNCTTSHLIYFKMGMIEFELLAYPKRDFEDSSRITKALNSH